MNKLLEKYRKQIDNIDFKLVELLKKRIELSKKIGFLKNENGVCVYDKNREKEILDKIVKEFGLKGFNKNYIKKVFKLILNNSKDNQRL